MASYKRNIIVFLGTLCLFVVAMCIDSYAWYTTTTRPNTSVGYYLPYTTDDTNNRYIPYGGGLQVTRSAISSYDFYINGSYVSFSNPNSTNYITGFTLGESVNLVTRKKSDSSVVYNLNATVRNYHSYTLYGAKYEYYFNKYAPGHSAWEYGTQYINYGDVVSIDFEKLENAGTYGGWGGCFGDDLSMYLPMYGVDSMNYTFVYDGSQTGWWRVYHFDWYSSSHSDLKKLTREQWKNKWSWIYAIDWPDDDSDAQAGISGPWGGFYIAPNNVTVTYTTVDADTGVWLENITRTVSPGAYVRGADLGTGQCTYNGLDYVYYYDTGATASQGTQVIRYLRKKQYNVTFQPNGGTGSASTQMYLYDTQYTTPNPGTRTGYTFKGWSKSSTGSVQYSTTVANVLVRSESASSTTLYAIWEANKYTVSFTNTRDSTVPNKQVTYMSAYSTLPVASSTGWRFVCWELNGNLVNSSTTVTTPSDHQLVAVWEEIKRNVTFVSPSKTQVTSILDGSNAFPPYTPDEVGMIFKYWSLTSNGTEYNFSDKVTTDTILYAVFEPKIISIELPGIGNITRSYNSEIGNLPTPVQDGFTFDGWYYDTGLSQKVMSTDRVKSEDYGLVPKFTNQTYTITYSTDNTKVNIAYLSAIPNTPVPDIAGKVFDGWYTTEGLAVKGGDTYIWSHDIVLNPKWSDISYTLILPDDSVREKKYGDKIGDLPLPKNTETRMLAGYADQFGQQVDMNTTVTKNLVISYLYTEKQVDVTLVDEASTSTVSVPAGTRPTSLPQRYKSGYVFKGWALNNGGAVSTAPIINDTKLYSVYGDEKQRVVFEGTDVILELPVGQAIGVLPNIEQDNKYLVGWKDSNGELVSKDTLVQPGGMVLTPVFETKGGESDKVEVRYWSDAVKINTVDMIKGDPLWDPGDPPLKQVTGRTFLYWSSTPNGNKYRFGSYINSDLDLYAVWK